MIITNDKLMARMMGKTGSCAKCRQRHTAICTRGIRRFLALVVYTLLVTFLALSLTSDWSTASPRKLDKFRLNLKTVSLKLTNLTSRLKNMVEAVDCQRDWTEILQIEKGVICSTEEEYFRRDISPRIRQIIRDELEIYDSDKTGLPDYALESLGGSIVSTKDMFMNDVKTYDSYPQAVIQPDMRPGSCWAFSGDRGTIVIRLAAKIWITQVSLEHISPKHSSEEISSAPKTFEVWGLTTLEDDASHFYGSFKYSDEGRAVQTFKVRNRCPVPHEYVEVKFLSNYGHQFTCVYRVRIHGQIQAQKHL